MLRVKQDENSIAIVVNGLVKAHGKHGLRVGRRFVHAIGGYLIAQISANLDMRDAEFVPDAVKHLKVAADDVTGLCPALEASEAIRVIRAIPDTPDGRTMVSVLHTDYPALAIGVPA